MGVSLTLITLRYHKKLGELVRFSIWIKYLTQLFDYQSNKFNRLVQEQSQMKCSFFNCLILDQIILK